MKVLISNQIVVEGYSSDLYNWCEENLVVKNPIYEQMMKMNKEDVIRYRHINKYLKFYSTRGDRLIIPFGCLRGIWEIIKNADITTKFNDAKTLSFENDKCCFESLYDYQEEAINTILKAKGGVIQAGCGSGKTVMGIELIKRINQKALWLTHTHDLLKQAAKDIKEMYPNAKIGYITDGQIDIGEDITIATVQTLSKAEAYMYADEFGVVVTDECHRVASDPIKAKMFQKVLEQIPARYKIGLTATPFRNDSLGKTIFTNIGMNLEAEFAPTFIIGRERTNTLTSEHIKVDVDTPNSWDILKADGTLDYSSLVDYLCNNEERNKFIVEKVLECHKEGRKQAILSLRVSHCEELGKMLKEKGLRVEIVTGKSTAKSREKALNEIQNWDVIIATVQLFKEGINIKPLDTMHFVTPVKEKSGVIQSEGRICRVFEGKKDPKFFDYVDVNIPYCLGAYKKRKSYLKNKE